MAASTRHHPIHNTLNRVWDVGTLDWIPMTQPGGGSGGGGDASAANQVTGNASLAAIKTDVDKIPALGQALAASSTPVVLTAAQVATLTPLGTVAVTGTFWQATQPVSGTFWQATQPISIATMPSTPVTGTFWQATQPVSGTVTTTPPANASTNVAQMAGVAPSLNTGVRDAGTQRVTIATNDVVPVTGTFFQTTQPVSIASMPSTAVTNAGTFAVQAAATLAAETTKVIGTVNVAAAQTIAVTQATAANLNATVTPIALTKGTQGATGFSTQDLKDSGRVNIMWTAEFSPIGVAEALLTMTESRDGAAVTTPSSITVTSGKRLRITSIDLVVENTLGVNPKRAKLRLKFNTAGATTTASPLQGTWAASVATAVNTIGQTMFADFPDGIEYLGNGTKTLGFTLESPDWVTAAQTSKVYITIFSFEY